MRFLPVMRLLEPLLGSLRGCFDRFPDKRLGANTTYPMGNIGMAAFSVFFMQSPSFLAHQRYLQTGQGRNNCQTLFGVDKIPCDNQIRAMLDPVEPTHFYPMFADIMAALRQSGGLDAMRCLDGSEGPRA